jgi:hypothetical protein
MMIIAMWNYQRDPEGAESSLQNRAPSVALMNRWRDSWCFLALSAR